MIYLQNKVTGEIVEVEPNSQAYRDIIAERTPQNKPVFEQLSDAQVAAKIERAEGDKLRDSDLPKNAQVTQDKNSLEGFGVQARPWDELTDAEVDLGLTPESKAKEQADTIDTVRANANAQSRADAAATIAGSDTQRRGGAGVASDIPAAIDGDGNEHGESQKETGEQAAKRISREQREKGEGDGDGGKGSE